MASKPVAQLHVYRGVERGHSRPHISNDNAYSEAAFKTWTGHTTYDPGSHRTRAAQAAA